MSEEIPQLAINYCNSTIYEDTIHISQNISIIRIITSILSILGSSSIIIAVFLTGKLNSSEVHPLFALSVGDFIVSCTWLFGGALWLHNRASDLTPEPLGLCYILAVATLVINVITYLLTTVYAGNALLRMKFLYKNRGRQVLEQSKRYKHVIIGLIYLLCWLLPPLLILPVTETQVGLPSANNACWCFIDFFNLRPDNGLSEDGLNFDELATIIATYTGTVFLLCTLLITLFYGFTVYYAWRILRIRGGYQLEARSKKTIVKFLIRASSFVFIFIFCGLPAFSGSILVWHEKTPLTLRESSDMFVLYWQAVGGPLQGILNAIVYGWSRKEFRKVLRYPFKMNWCCSKRNQGSTNDEARLIVNNKYLQ